jgi:hypothetical protein
MVSDAFAFKLMTLAEARRQECDARERAVCEPGLPGKTAARGGWDFTRLAVAFVISILLQMLFLPCLCELGAVKLEFAAMLDLIILFRAGIAYLRREQGRTWMFYAGVLYTSPVWISVVVELAR